MSIQLDQFHTTQNSPGITFGFWPIFAPQPLQCNHYAYMMWPYLEHRRKQQKQLSGVLLWSMERNWFDSLSRDTVRAKDLSIFCSELSGLEVLECHKRHLRCVKGSTREALKRERPPSPQVLMQFTVPAKRNQGRWYQEGWDVPRTKGDTCVAQPLMVTNPASSRANLLPETTICYIVWDEINRNTVIMLVWIRLPSKLGDYERWRKGWWN